MKALRTMTILAALLWCVSCAKPPQAEIDAAKAALEAASKSADVITYAPDSLRSAQEKAAELEGEIVAQGRKSALSRNYESSKSLALEAANAARKAMDDAGTAKAQVALDASSLLDEVSASIPAVESKVWAARRVPRIRLEVIGPLGLVPEMARRTIDDAGRDIGAGSFASAKAKLMAVKDRLSSCEQTIAEQTRIARSH
jgi:hypothetical protein